MITKNFLIYDKNKRICSKPACNSHLFRYDRKRDVLSCPIKKKAGEIFMANTLSRLLRKTL